MQCLITLPTTEAEYIVLTSATKESIWRKGLVGELCFAQDFATVYCDSLSAICFAIDQVRHDRTKHINVRYHSLRTNNRVKVKKIGNSENPNNFFIKFVPFSKFKKRIE